MPGGGDAGDPLDVFGQRRCGAGRRLEGVEFAARLGRHYRAPVGSMQRLYLDLAEMHLFDPRTTMAVPRDM